MPLLKKTLNERTKKTGRKAGLLMKPACAGFSKP